MSATENTYGFLKRLEFIVSIIEESKPLRVLDIGCGTGEHLTRPLGEKFSQVEFVAVDSDEKSINYAKAHNSLSNITFFHEVTAENLGVFDLVILSEVIEHEMNPTRLLQEVRSNLSDSGCAIVTLPNGYGPFEWAQLIEALFFFCGGYRVVRFFRARNLPTNQIPVLDSLAVSPHINFFGYREVVSLFNKVGFRISKFSSRTFLCGFGFDKLLKSKASINWNCRIADRLPPQFSSAWMFVLKPTTEIGTKEMRRNRYTRLRRHINLKRWSGE